MRRITMGTVIALMLGAALALGAWPATSLAAAGPTFSQVDAGALHACGLLSNGRAICWGNDYLGGNDVPTATFLQLSVGDDFGCGLKADHTIVCWGDGTDGRTTPPSGTFSAVSAGDAHACAITTGGTVVCWGRDDFGDTHAPAGSFSQVSTGYELSCGVQTSGQVVCWGDNGYGASAPAGAFSQVSISYSQFACGLKTDQTISCWDSNLSGEGNAPAGTFSQVTVGFNHSCALKTDQTVVCWGGQNSSDELTPPVGVKFTQIDAGDYFTCGVTTTSALVCWGVDHSGDTVPPAAPTITSQPQGTTLTVGQSLTLSVAASGNPAPSYQWYHNGNPITGATGSSFEVAAVTMSDAGSYDVVAHNEIGGDSYSATSQIVSVTVNQATPMITWASPAPITYGTLLGSTQLDATAVVDGKALAGTWTYAPGAGAILDAGVHTLTVSFVPSDTTNYTTASGSVQLMVNPATPAIQWTSPSPITYGTPLDEQQLNASVSVPGTATYDPPAGTVLSAGTHTLRVSFVPSDTTGYTAAAASVQLTVKPATPVIAWARPAAITYGTALSDAQLNASASIPGSFHYSPSAGSILDAGTQTLGVTFTPSDSVNYTQAGATVSLTVNTAPLTVNADDQAKLVGEPNPPLTGTITGLVNQDPITASYSTTATDDSPAGTYPIVPALNDPNSRLGNYTVTIITGTLTVKENAVTLYDAAHAKNAGSTFPVTIQIQDASGNNVSSPDLIVHAVEIVDANGTSYPVQSAGNSQPNDDFRYDPTLGGTGGYVFNLKTTGLPPGSYTLHFTVGGSTILHGVQFAISE